MNPTHRYDQLTAGTITAAAFGTEGIKNDLVSKFYFHLVELYSEEVDKKILLSCGCYYAYMSSVDRL
ncbi:MAG: hypothetical protein AAGC85_03015 [Bacteroidota bacterium]